MEVEMLYALTTILANVGYYAIPIAEIKSACNTRNSLKDFCHY